MEAPAFGAGKDKTVVGQYHNVVFEQRGDEVNAEVEEGAKENGRFSKSCDFIPFRFNFPKRRDPPTALPQPNPNPQSFLAKIAKKKKKKKKEIP